MTFPTTAEEVSAIPPEEFLTLIQRNVSPRHDGPVAAEERASLWEVLMLPPVIGRTLSTLTAVLMSIDGDLGVRRTNLDKVHESCIQEGRGGKRKYYEAKLDYDRWRVSALEMKKHVTAHHQAVKAKREFYLSNPETARQLRRATPANPEKFIRAVDALFKIVVAVDKHRDDCAEAGVTPEDHDLVLWSKLDEIKVMLNGVPVSLSAWQEDIMSKPTWEPQEGI